MIKFIKKQLLRSWYIIKDYWSLFDLSKDKDLTNFNKYFMGAMIIIVLCFFTAIIIILLPVILLSFKE